ncbi:unnamed protein product [Peniophora sp. CBMAI 1063]|nr:unnamed protein product [Peniophora sp. CBMAI 1063]
MSDVSFTFFAHPSATALHDAWKRSIAELLSTEDQSQGLITVLARPFEDMSGAEAAFDCLVSPANSYGIMDGGIDMYISRAFSGGGDLLTLSRAIQGDLYARWYGFAPPTSCTLVRIPEHLRNAQYPRCTVLAVCPTMRVPTDVSWHKDLAYNVVCTLLCELERWNEGAGEEGRIRRVAIPGLATGTGRYDPDMCARQMVLAVKHFRDARSKEGRERLADRRWTTNAFNRLEEAMQVAGD